MLQEKLRWGFCARQPATFSLRVRLSLKPIQPCMKPCDEESRDGNKRNTYESAHYDVLRKLRTRPTSLPRVQRCHETYISNTRLVMSVS